MPSWDLADAEELNGGGDPATTAVPTDAESMRLYIQNLTTPETQLEQQLLGEVQRWAVRHEPAPGQPGSAGPGLACSSASNLRDGTGPSLTGNGSDTDSNRSSSDNASASSGQRSEEGSSAAWRLCTWLQRAGWPAQHCASIRTGSSGGGSASGWKFSSGHEFLLLHPHQCRGSACSSDDSGGCGGDSSMRTAGDMSQALVIDPEFSTQFALAVPSPRYHALVSLLPRTFVGSYERLQQLVEWVCREMQTSFKSGGAGVPAWRSLAHVLDKWRLREEDGQEQAGQEDDEASTLPAQLHSGRECPGAAFSDEQQEAMRHLLLQPGFQAPRPLTASSSISSMDVASPQLPSFRSRSLLTRELVDQVQVEEAGDVAGKLLQWQTHQRQQSQRESGAPGHFL
ncbi:hypothetical protein D9Q98_006721 [Chlorella vulgaris]|uniref:Uncharacterized protein n=1 Tax=Chlorella vulgaris TaxID=3077 RepID=A0A9D4TKS7_CHLVU|nr:hypothetical protein D9Q98_006721 [Chlorella vulgaris]